MSTFDTFSRIPVVNFVLNILKTWQFWALFGLLAVLGMSMREYLDEKQHAVICGWYKDNIAPELNKQIQTMLAKNGAATSAPVSNPTTMPTNTLANQIAAVVDAYFCMRAHSETDNRMNNTNISARQLQIQDAQTVVPGAFVLALMIGSLLPTPPKKKDLTRRLDQADDVARREPDDHTAVILSSDLRSVSENYPEAALTARQLRIATAYAIVSGLVTMAFPPVFDPARSFGFSQGTSHFYALLVATIAAVLFGIYPFASSRIPTRWLAWKLGFGPIFFAGFIVNCVSTPYQALRPASMVPLSRQQIITIVILRCILLPTMGFIAVAASRRIFKSLPSL